MNTCDPAPERVVKRKRVVVVRRWGFTRAGRWRAFVTLPDGTRMQVANNPPREASSGP